MSAIQSNFSPTPNLNIGNIGGANKSESKESTEIINTSEFDQHAGKHHGAANKQKNAAAVAMRNAAQRMQQQRARAAAAKQQDPKTTGLDPTNRLEQLEEKEPIENDVEDYCNNEHSLGELREELKSLDHNDPKFEETKKKIGTLEETQAELFKKPEVRNKLAEALENGKNLEAKISLDSLLNTTDGNNKQVPKKPLDIYKELVNKCDGKPEMVLAAMNQVSSANGDRLRQRPEGPKAMMQMKAGNTMSLIRSTDDIASNVRKGLSEMGLSAESLRSSTEIVSTFLNISSFGKGGGAKLANSLLSSHTS